MYQVCTKYLAVAPLLSSFIKRGRYFQKMNMSQNRVQNTTALLNNLFGEFRKCISKDLLDILSKV